MRFRWILLGVTLGWVSAPSAEEAGQRTPSGESGLTAEVDDRRFRDTGAYPFGAPASTVRDMQLLATAMQLRAFCADPMVPDEFVRDRLQRFSLMTGRAESCRSLLDY